jgi:hypothetical protein
MWYTVTQGNYRVWHLMIQILSCQYCLCGLLEGSLKTVVGIRVALDSVNNETLRVVAHILCETVHVKQVDRICAARVSSEIWWWSVMWGCTFRKINGHWVRQWRETQSVQVKARNCRNTARSPENIQRVRIALDRSPRWSVRQQRWQQCPNCHGGQLQDNV